MIMLIIKVMPADSAESEFRLAGPAASTRLGPGRRRSLVSASLQSGPTLRLAATEMNLART